VNRFHTVWLLALGSVVVHAHATDYLSVTQAQRLMFADATRFQPLDAATQQAALRKMAGQGTENMEAMHLQVWGAWRDQTLLGWFVTDKTIGKFEFIDYAVALDTAGRIRHVEVMAYRESHGEEVRRQSWLGQFTGKSASDALEPDEDIPTISGATLSSAHMTEGLRRITRFARLALVVPAPAAPQPAARK
jgi:hypothetical protein